jgi:hypothetical protein
MEHSSQKKSVAITAIVVALGIIASTAVNAFLMTTTPAYAAPTKDKVIVRDQGTGALAFWDDINVEVPDVGTVLQAEIRAFETEAGTDIIVGLILEDGNFAFGFTTIDQNVFEIDKKLTSATLSPVTVEVTIFDDFFNEIGTAAVTVQATWEGFGDTLTQKAKVNTNFEGFSEKFKGSLQVRGATAEGSIDNLNLGTTDLAQLRAFKQVVMTVSESTIT